MALSIYSNCEIDNPNPILGPPYDYQSEVADALIGFYDPVDIKIDSLFDPPPTDVDLSNAEISNSNLIPSYSDPCILSLPSDLYPVLIADDFDYWQCPKRPKSCGDLYQPHSLAFGHSFVGSDTSCWKLMDFVAPPAPAEGCIVEKKSGSGGYLSAQSVAARERRKRISEKTHELGRLIPGGNKMNTAEMFQAAFKYVKFLQAQVGILGAIGSVQGSESSLEVEEQLQVLVTSPTIQEKLYGEGKCIVSKRVVEKLAKEPEIKSTQAISRDLDRFVQSMR